MHINVRLMRGEAEREAIRIDETTFEAVRNGGHTERKALSPPENIGALIDRVSKRTTEGTRSAR